MRPDRLAPVRQPLLEQGFPPAVVSTMLRSRRESTWETYAAGFERFTAFCAARGLQNDNLISLCSYLQHLMDEGKAFSTIRAAAVACSVFMPRLPNGKSMGSAPEIEAMLAGVANTLPPRLPARHTWDAGQVLRHLRDFQGRSNDDLLALSRDTALLLALCTAWRPRSDLARIPIDRVEVSDSGIRLIALRPKEGAFKEIFIRPSPEAPCPVVFLKRYLDATSAIRPVGSNLFLATTSPHDSASGDTIAHWVEHRLRDAGVVDTAHSTRGTAASAAAARGIPLDTILRAANWASAATFNRHYRRDFVAESLPLGTNFALPEAAQAASGPRPPTR